MSSAVRVHTDWLLYNRLFKFARKLGYDIDRSRDFGCEAYSKALEKGVAEWHYASVCLKNLVLIDRRNRKRRNLDYKFHEFDDGQVVELVRLAVKPAQHKELEFKDLLAAFEILPEVSSKALQLAGLEYTADEISEKLSIPKKEVYWRLRVARKILRERGYHDAFVKRGHSEYVGIRKDHHRWCAALRRGDDYQHLGYFATAVEAAKAYDTAAIAADGARAKTNFGK